MANCWHVCSDPDDLCLVLVQLAPASAHPLFDAFDADCETPVFHLFSNPQIIGPTLNNTFSTKFSQSPTNHFNLANLICTMFSIFNQTLQTLERSSTTVTLKRPSFSSRLKQPTDHLLITHLFFGMLFQKNVANLPFILLTLVNLVLLLYFFIYIGYRTSQFHSNLKTYIFHQSFSPYSVSRTHVTSLSLLTGFRTSISHSFSFVHPQPFHSPSLQSILMYTVYGK